MGYHALTALQNMFLNCIIGRGMDSSRKPFAEEMQQHYIKAWREYQPGANVKVELTIEGALSLARAADRGAGIHTLITGSLYLIGSALRLLEST